MFGKSLQRLQRSLGGKPLQQRGIRLLELQKKLHDLYTSARGFRLHGSELNDQMADKRQNLKQDMVKIVHSVRLISDSGQRQMTQQEFSSSVVAASSWRQNIVRSLWRDLAMHLRSSAAASEVKLTAGSVATGETPGLG